MHRRAYRTLLHNRRFMRLWSAQIVSNLGDWAYTLAVAVTLTATLHDSALVRSMALILVVEGLSSTLVGLTIAGPIADRFPRTKVMVVADIVRCVAVASLLLPVGLHLPHVLAVAAVLGSFRAIFHPALMASVPSLVGDDEVPVANGVLSATFHLAIMVGPALGGILVAALGARSAFLLNSMSFAISAVLLLGLPLTARTDTGREAPFRPWHDLREGARFLLRSRAAWGIAVIMTMTLMLLAMQSSFQVAFVGRVLAPEGTPGSWSTIIGILVATFGAGMVLGSLVAPALIRRLPPRRVFAALTSIVGIGYGVASQTDAIPVAIAMWGVIGLCGGTVNVLYETWLQIETPDGLRGRVFAAVESSSDGGYVLGAVLVAALWATVSPSAALLCVGVGFVGLGLLCVAILPGRRPLADPPND